MKVVFFMGKTNVLEKNYEKLQNDIQALNDKWSGQVSDIKISGMDKPRENNSPLIPQLELTIDVKQYQSFVEELLQLISKDNDGITAAANKIKTLLSTEVLQKWFQEAIVVNQFYFKNFADEHGLPEWLPIFAAEHAVRPYLQKATAELAESLKKVDHHHGCPSCGEPARLALVGKNGKKELTCPRCLHTWEEKKISCAHCGKEGELVIFKIEGEESAEVHACNSCKGYTKVIDVRKMFKKQSPTLLDVKSIHLDYIAQEKGYGATEGSEAH